MDHITLTANQSGPVRRESLMGREHVVVPATLVKSQVLHNNLGRTFLPAEEITEAWVETANGAPVVVDHPTKSDRPISARSPGVLNTMGGGWLLNTRVENGEAKGDVFLDPARREDVPDLDVILTRIEAGEPVELSTGFPLRAIEKSPGVHNGKAYDVVIRPAGFDHLAVFAKKKGACSVDDGCGLGVNCTCDGGTDVENADEVAASLWERLKGFLAQNHNEETRTMKNREDVIAALAANDAVPFTTCTLTAMGADELAHVANGAELDVKGIDLAPAKEPEGKPEPAQNADEPPAWAKDLIRDVTELKESAAPAINEHRAEHGRLVKALAANDRCPFDASELEDRGLEELRKLDSMARNRDYSGRAGPRPDSEDVQNVDLGFEVTDWHEKPAEA